MAKDFEYSIDALNYKLATVRVNLETIDRNIEYSDNEHEIKGLRKNREDVMRIHDDYSEAKRILEIAQRGF